MGKYTSISFPGLGLEMNPDRAIHIGNFTVYYYGAIIAIGLLLAVFYGLKRSKAFGLKQGVEGDDHGMIPPTTTSGIDIMSVNLMLEDETKPVVWRGPVIAGAVKQFWTDTIWNDIDYMLIDCPPGTGDVPLTVFQSIPIDGIVIVSSPQELVSMIVKKAAKKR